MKSLHNWHQTKLGLFVFGIVELAIAYGFASLAINSGSLWWYLLTLIFLVGALQNLFKLIGRFFHGQRKTS
ncbi:MAG TPA: hypothetical protein VHC21_00445 [Candidatus Saccharimonadales bacterium]|nr:hypothetical protein [Candidatus Saccharimonadales bacterium]